MQGPARQETVGCITPQELQLHRADPPQCQQTPVGPHSGSTSFGLPDLFHSPRFISSSSAYSVSVFIGEIGSNFAARYIWVAAMGYLLLVFAPQNSYSPACCQYESTFEPFVVIATFAEPFALKSVNVHISVFGS